MPIRVGQDAFPKLVEYLQICELVGTVCGGWDVLRWVGAIYPLTYNAGIQLHKYQHPVL